MLDADGLWVLSMDLEIITSSLKVTLTPNVVEYGRLVEAVERRDGKKPETVSELCCALGQNVVVVVKGPIDRIGSSTSNKVLECSEQGSLRRCGGQGDVLSGLTTLFMAWSSLAEQDDGVEADR